MRRENCEGPGLGFSVTSYLNQAAVRSQVFDLVALGFTTQYLDTQPAILFVVTLRETPNVIPSSVDQYNYQIKLANGSNIDTLTYRTIFSPTPISVSGTMTFNVTILTTGALRYGFCFVFSLLSLLSPAGLNQPKNSSTKLNS